jgi:hypothetical protein
MRAAELPPAHAPSQIAAYLEIVLAVGMGCALFDHAPEFFAIVGALGAGAILSNVTPIGKVFTNVSGVIVSLCAVLVTLVLGAFSDRLLAEDPWLALWAVAALVLGLDWCFAPRLRARVVFSGVIVIPLVGADEQWAYPGAVAWFIGAIATLWLLERDVRRAATRPVPLVPTPRRRTRPAEFAGPAAVALLAGLAATFLIADVTCAPRRTIPLTGADSSRRASGPDWSPGGLLRLDVRSGSYLPDPGAPGRIPVPDPGGVPVERDERGRAVIRQPDGSTRTYDRDALGRDRVTVDGEDGRRTFVYDENGNGLRITEYDEQGEVVQEYVYDPDLGGSGGGGGSDTEGAAGAAGGERSPTPTTETGDPHDEPSTARSWGWWLLALGVIAVAAAVMVAALVSRARRAGPAERPRTWAARLADRLDEEGRRRGRSRATGETVVGHADALADGPLPDDRLRNVGSIVSAALFGRTTPPEDTRAWAESVVDDASASHPPPSRRVRRRRHTRRRSVLPPASSR